VTHVDSVRPTDPAPRPETVEGGPVARFLRAWQEGRQPQLEALIADDPGLSLKELAAIVQVDIDLRWRRNNPAQAESYLASFPALSNDPELAVDVIYAEYLARERSGECPGAAEYQRRFPAFAEELSRQIGLHRALETIGDDSDAQVSPFQLSGDSLFESTANSPEFDASYEILEEIGRGGMGVVYKARQVALKRLVALKMVRAVDATNQELLARFRSEARAVASLRHPNIVQVHDFGEHDGLPFLAMELIEGGTLAARLHGNPWPAREAATLMIKLAGAVQFAHDHHVVHRDLKPANVLVVSDQEGLEVKITDFGLAKFFQDEMSPHTKTGAFLGTPSYMAPEQARGRTQEVGPAADIYSLGAMLYELLTGRPPFCGSSPMEILQQLAVSEPISVHRLAPHTPRDLATICEKCLNIEIGRRYASAAELRADLERYLAGVPVHARPTGVVERTWRWCRRNPSWAIALGSVVMLLLGIAVLSLSYSAMLRRELARTEQAERSERVANQSAQRRLWDAYMAEVTARNVSRQVGQRFAALDTIEKAAALLDIVGQSEDRVVELRSGTLSSVARCDVRVVRTLGPWPPNSGSCDMSSAADRYVIAVENGPLVGYRLFDGQKLWSLDHPGRHVKASLSPDGRLLAASDDSGTKLWRVDGSQPRLAWEAAGAQYFTFSPDGRHAAYSQAVGGMKLVNVETGVPVRPLGKGAARSRFALHPASRQVAVCVAASVQVISWDTGEIKRQLPVGKSPTARLAWHPSGRYLAVWADTSQITVWDVKAGTQLFTFPHRGVPAQLLFNDDGSLLVSHSLWDQRLLVWDFGAGQRLLEVHGFKNQACDVADGRRIVLLGDRGDKAVLTELTPGVGRTLTQSVHRPLGFCFKVAMGPEGRVLVASSEGGLEFWDIGTAQRLLTCPIGRCLADFDDGGRLIVGTNAGVFRFVRRIEISPAVPNATPRAARTLVRFDSPEQLAGPIEPGSLSTNARGETMLIADSDGWAVLHPGHHTGIVRLQTGRDARKSAASDDNRYAAIANWNDGGAAVWDVFSGAHLADLPVGRHGTLQFSRDGRLLAATPDGVTLWRTSDWRCVGQLHAEGTTPTGLGISFSPDSRVLAVAQPNGVLRFVDPTTGKDWARVALSDQSAASTMTFSPDQRFLVTSPVDERLPSQVWDLTAMRSELARRGIDWPADVLRSTPNPQAIDGDLEVVLDDGGLMHRFDGAIESNTAIQLWENAMNFLQRATRAAAQEKGAK
jgi:WD40 repeat protein/tRNA A-37 threonylcarbamoyl transferase component Bud32